jgi:hypothetical protein
MGCKTELQEERDEKYRPGGQLASNYNLVPGWRKRDRELEEDEDERQDGERPKRNVELRGESLDQPVTAQSMPDRPRG